MPFTPAHPMVVLPLLRGKWLDATCLVIGAMAPDFEYFIHGQESGNFGHTLVGVALWGVPVTLIAAAIFHALVKDTLLLVAPVAIARRLASVPRWPAVPLVVMVASAVLGNLTHLAWDGLTHERGWGERWAPDFFGMHVAVPVIGHMVMYRVLQYVSSVIGLGVVAVAAIRAIRRRRPRELPEVPRALARSVFAACTLAGITAVTARVIYIVHATDPGSLVVAPISGLLAGTLVASALLYVPARAWRSQIERRERELVARGVQHLV